MLLNDGYLFPGIDSWVQPRLNLDFSWVLKLKLKLCSNSFPKERDAQSGQYTAHYSCINHNDWRFNYIYKEINIKKSSRFGKNIINQMRRDGIIPQFANIVSMQCYSTYKNR